MIYVRLESEGCFTAGILSTVLHNGKKKLKINSTACEIAPIAGGNK